MKGHKGDQEAGVWMKTWRRDGERDDERLEERGEVFFFFNFVKTLNP